MTTLTQEHRNHTVAPGLWAALRASVAQWSAHKDARVGAAIAYYSIFSIGPLIVVAISIASLVFDREGVQREVISSLQSLIGNKGAESVNSMLGAAGSQGEGLFATAIGVVTLLYAAISLVVQLKEAMNSVWEVETTPGSGLWGFVRIYVLSLAGVVTGGFLLLVSMLLAAGLAAFGKYIGTFIPEALLQGAGFFVSLGVISLVFALMFKWLPDADVSWRDVWLGRHGGALRDRQVRDRLLHREAGARVKVRCRRIHRGCLGLDLLHGPTHSARCRVYERAPSPAFSSLTALQRALLANAVAVRAGLCICRTGGLHCTDQGRRKPNNAPGQGLSGTPLGEPTGPRSHIAGSAGPPLAGIEDPEPMLTKNDGHPAARLHDAEAECCCGNQCRHNVARGSSGGSPSPYRQLRLRRRARRTARSSPSRCSAYAVTRNAAAMAYDLEE
jgi:membrane protein